MTHDGDIVHPNFSEKAAKKKAEKEAAKKAEEEAAAAAQDEGAEEKKSA